MRAHLRAFAIILIGGVMTLLALAPQTPPSQSASERVMVQTSSVVQDGLPTNIIVYAASQAMLLRRHTPRLVGCSPSGPPFVFHGSSTRRAVALTFDDGPGPDTPKFVGVLEREHVRATFFQIGDLVARFGRGGAVERRMLADGDMIGDETWSHVDVAGDGTFAANQIRFTAAAISRATGGFEPCLFRAPYGAISGALIAEARALGFTTIQWDVDPRDWSRPGAIAIYRGVVDRAHNGAIILQHDGGGDRSETLAALTREIETLRNRRYAFVTITELLSQRPVYR
jgi:peptidoglycan/xylan/chitin deacetylase (PgdA/CDA1 family)